MEAGPEVLREGELSLPLIGCSTRESGPCTSRGQHSRAGPEGVGVGEPTLMMGKQENSGLLHGNAGELTLVVKTGKNW